MTRLRIGDEGAAALVRALKVICTLTTLKLYDKSFGGEGVPSFAQALKVNCTLTVSLSSVARDAIEAVRRGGGREVQWIPNVPFRGMRQARSREVNGRAPGRSSPGHRLDPGERAKKEKENDNSLLRARVNEESE